MLCFSRHTVQDIYFLSHFHSIESANLWTCQDMHGQRFGRWPGLHFLLAHGADFYRLFADLFFYFSPKSTCSVFLVIAPRRQGSNFWFVIPEDPNMKDPDFPGVYVIQHVA